MPKSVSAVTLENNSSFVALREKTNSIKGSLVQGYLSQSPIQPPASKTGRNTVLGERKIQNSKPLNQSDQPPQIRQHIIKGATENKSLKQKFEKLKKVMPKTVQRGTEKSKVEAKIKTDV